MANKKISLRSTSDAGGSRYLDASIQPNGDLLIEGQDLGPAVEEFFGFSEYEWKWTVAAADCEKLYAALGGADLLEALVEQFSGDNAAGLDDFLVANDIPYDMWSRLGD